MNAGYFFANEPLGGASARAPLAFEDGRSAQIGREGSAAREHAHARRHPSYLAALAAIRTTLRSGHIHHNANHKILRSRVN